MSAEEIRKVLEDPQRRFIAEFCAEPQTSTDIFQAVKGVWSGYEKGTLASDLEMLEETKAVVFSEGKWKTGATAIEILMKYFAYSE